MDSGEFLGTVELLSPSTTLNLQSLNIFLSEPLSYSNLFGAGHRIQLVLKAIAQQRRYHKQMDRLLNMIHGFYNEHNRRMHFYKTAKRLGMKPLLVKKIFEIRFSVLNIKGIVDCICFNYLDRT